LTAYGRCVEFKGLFGLSKTDCVSLLLQWRYDTVTKILAEIDIMAAKRDIPSITTWQQGQYIDMPQYNRMPSKWKREQALREETIIRPYGGTNNPLFAVIGAENPAAITGYLETVGQYLAKLTEDLDNV
jgi:hypothetical protein